ncbi:hypothetical protein TNCV_4716281 [Trichonephila clavipes]|nr:hypothetical protein TNCV_4716281 [Trichonephila clavipes]
MILDVRFPKQKNRRVIFQCGDRARLTSEHLVLFTTTLPPQKDEKLLEKLYQKCTRNSVLRKNQFQEQQQRPLFLPIKTALQIKRGLSKAFIGGLIWVVTSRYPPTSLDIL